ncbi:MAG: tetratricopeptide repeat protein [Polyangia bacterium]|jgi:tetratricopeptide (TPR) repeat protein|nr:tetratricopeptide repeat protein [Polyangia bacterium]
MTRFVLLPLCVAAATMSCPGPSQEGGRGKTTAGAPRDVTSKEFNKSVSAADNDINLTKGRAALSRKPPDLQGALIAFEQALRTQPPKREARLNAAFCLLRLGRLGEAEAHYRAAAATPGDREALFGWVDVLLRLGRFEPAERAISSYLKAHPADLQALSVSSEVHRRSGAKDLALKRVQQALTLDRRDPGAHLMFARLYLDQKDARTALMIVNRGLAHHPRHAELLLARGLAWHALGEMGRAVMDIEAAVNADGDLVAGRLLLGKVYVDNLDFDGARRHFDAVLKSWPTHKEAMLGHARALFGKKRFKDALSGYLAAVQTHGHEPRAIFQIAKIYQEHLDSPKKALAYYKRFVKAQTGLPKDDPVFATIKMLESMSRPKVRPPAAPRTVAPPRRGGDRP